jgi:protocatechuate 3,4-dioxygenase beta subunit
MDKRYSLLLSVAVILSVLAGSMWASGSTERAGQITFSGRVLDSQGGPIADAKVAFYVLDYEIHGPSPEPELIEETVTGPDGAFRFTKVQGNQHGSVIARKDGLALGWAAWQMREGDRQSDIVVGEPRELSGTVVDDMDQPIIDAEVGVALAIIGREEDRRYLIYSVAPKVLTVRTDETGRFAFANVPGDATFELLAKKPGRATVCTFDPSTFSGEKLRFSPGQSGIKVALPPEARIEGKVVDNSGKPIGGVQVVAQPPQRGLPIGIESVESASDGTFFVGSLPAGGYTVRLVTQTEGIAEWVAEPVQVDLKAGETVRDVRLVLGEGGLVEVLVKEEAGGKPVEKASVSVRDVGRGQWLSGQTDAAGIARIRLTPGDYELSGVHKQGYTHPEQRETFAIAEGETRRFERTLGGLPSVTGVVYDDAGEPLEGVILQVIPGGGLGRGDVISDAQGEFKVSWDPRHWSPDRTVHYLVARHIERNLALAEPVADPGERMAVKLRPGVVLTGLVVDPNGKGIEGAELRIWLNASNWGASFLPHRSVKADAEGRFEVGAIPPEQRYTIAALAEDYGQVQVNLAEDQTATGRVQAGRFSLPIANLAVSGTVVDSEGKPVPGARLYCHGGDRTNQPDRQAQTDAEGRFTIERVCAGRIHIQANAQVGGTYRYGSIETEGGAGDVQIVVAERGSTRYVPRKPASLRGRALPDVKKLGIELPPETDGRMLLVCFWDMNQRPSRHCIGVLTRRAAELKEKGLLIVAVQAAQVQQGALEEWIEQNRPPFPVGRITGDIENTQFEWGAVSLPHLILTDREHIVVGEGFALLGELDNRIKDASGQ